MKTPTIPFGSIPDQQTVLTDGIYRLRVERVEERATRTGKLMFAVTARVVEPDTFRGLAFFDNFVIGTDDDPDATETSTWQQSIGSRTFKRFVRATGVAVGEQEPTDQLLHALTGAEYLCAIVQKIDDGSRDPQFKGRVRANATNYWKLGERTPGLDDARAKQRGNGAATPQPTTADVVTCTACRKRVPRAELKTHVSQHMKDIVTEESDLLE
jgi:hypothetical protein